MVTKGELTEQKILDAAQQVFHEKGFHGTRMQEIADTAEINKGLLHYYFKTKDVLFQKIFGVAFKTMFANMANMINSELPLREKLICFVDTYLSLLSKNSFLPVFVLSELNRNPDKFLKKMFAKKGKPDISPFFLQIEKEIEAGNIRDLDPRQLLMNIMSLCVFPYVARPMFQAVMNIPNPEYKKLMNERRTEIVDMIDLMIKPQ